MLNVQKLKQKHTGASKYQNSKLINISTAT